MNNNLHWKNLSIENIEGEKWNDIPEYDGIYQASNFGRVKSVDRIDSNGRFWKGKIRSQKISNIKNGSGVLQVVLSANSKYTTYTVQRLIFTAFHGLIDNKYLKVGHKNKNLLDNRIENLEIQSQDKIIKDSILMGNMIPNKNYGKTIAAKIAESYRCLDIGNGIRVCTKCGNAKPLMDFYKNKSNYLGRKRACKKCSA